MLHNNKYSPNKKLYLLVALLMVCLVTYYGIPSHHSFQEPLNQYEGDNQLELEQFTSTSPMPVLGVGVLIAYRPELMVDKWFFELTEEREANQELQNKVVLLAHFSGFGSTKELMDQFRDNSVSVYSHTDIYDILLHQNVPQTYGDSLTRVRWRTTEALDYIRLLNISYHHHPSEYLLVLQDDVKPAKYFLQKVLKSVEGFKGDCMYFYGTHSRNSQGSGSPGGVAWLYNRRFIPQVVSYISEHVFDHPIDNNLLAFLSNKQIYCDYRIPHLLQHNGHLSTFDDNNRKEVSGIRPGWKSFLFYYDEDNKTCEHLPYNECNYVGCFKDRCEHIHYRDFQGHFFVGEVDIQKCNEFCQNYRYFGLQYGSECYCGNEFGLYGQYSDSECNVPCRASPNSPKMCGGLCFNSVYKVNQTFSSQCS